MQDDKEDPKFEQWLKQHATSYNTPPTPDVERMWVAIEADHFDSNTLTHAHTLRATPIVKPTPWWSNSWMRVAAALVVGVGLGRISAVTPSITGAGTNSPAVAAVNASNSSSNAELVEPIDEPAASRYLGQTVALLASLQTDARGTTGDTLYKKHATDLLLTTRLLLDSPSARDPKVRALLDDLELVLAQIVQMPAKRNASDLDLIHQAMEQRDVMPRLRTAVANTSSAD